MKVPNADARPEDHYNQYLYIPADEYLADPNSYDIVVKSTPPPKEEEWRPVQLDEAPLSEVQEAPIAGELGGSLHFRKKLMVLPFHESATPSERGFADIFMQELASRIESTSGEVILFDAEVMKQMEEGKGITREMLESSEMIRRVGERYNIHAVLTGTIDHVFVSSRRRLTRGRSETAYAIAEIDARLVDTSTGKVRRRWEKRNPMFDSEGKGDFSEEKAQLKALELIASDLVRDIIEELDRLTWYTRIAGVDVNQVYISAGKLSGVQVGDTFSVFPATSPGEPKGEIRIATLFGIDASIGDIIKGNGFATNDLVRPVFQ